MSSAIETTPIVLRDIEDTAEMRAVEDLQIEAWEDAERDIVPLNQLAAARHVGGTLIGAFAGEVLAGFVYGFYGHVHGQIIHHSHMLAVHSAYRNYNLAFRLKLAQRDRVLAESLTDRITWTFDPLQSLNAHFNFGKLGAVSGTYKINVYGEAGTSFLHQNGTDRFFVTWLLRSPRVIKRISERPLRSPGFDIPTQKILPLIRCSDSGAPELNPSDADFSGSEFALVEIPTDINAIEESDFSTARRWRLETRRVFSETFAAGFIVTNYSRRDEKIGTYLLEKKRLEDCIE